MDRTTSDRKMSCFRLPRRIFTSWMTSANDSATVDDRLSFGALTALRTSKKSGVQNHDFILRQRGHCHDKHDRGANHHGGRKINFKGAPLKRRRRDNSQDLAPTKLEEARRRAAANTDAIEASRESCSHFLFYVLEHSIIVEGAKPYCNGMNTQYFFVNRCYDANMPLLGYGCMVANFCLVDPYLPSPDVADDDFCMAWPAYDDWGQIRSACTPHRAVMCPCGEFAGCSELSGPRLVGRRGH
jgi:hypothetical protein